MQGQKAACARVASGCDAAQTSCRVAALPRVRGGGHHLAAARGCGCCWTLDNQIMNAGWSWAAAGPAPLLGPDSSLQTLGQDDKFCTCMKLKHSPRTTAPQQNSHTHVYRILRVPAIPSHMCSYGHTCTTRVSCHMKAPFLSDLLWSCHHSSGENRDRQHQDCFLQTQGNMG